MYGAATDGCACALGCHDGKCGVVVDGGIVVPDTAATSAAAMYEERVGRQSSLDVAVVYVEETHVGDLVHARRVTTVGMR